MPYLHLSYDYLTKSIQHTKPDEKLANTWTITSNQVISLIMQYEIWQF